MHRLLLVCCLVPLPCVSAAPPERPSLPYRELTGKAEEFRFVRQWRSYYWREDFTFVLRTAEGKTWRVISREPTPWNHLRLGTTYTKLEVDWAKKPTVRVIGVEGIDRTPVEFPDLKLDPANTVTAFIVRVEGEAGGKKLWRDYYVNNWFHPWSKEADVKMLSHYTGDDPNYTVYGFLGSNVAPVDRAGKTLLEKYQPEYGGIIYHARVVKADNPVGHELRLIHLMGRHRKTLEYRVFHGDPKALIPLDGRAPKKK